MFHQENSLETSLNDIFALEANNQINNSFTAG